MEINDLTGVSAYILSKQLTNLFKRHLGSDPRGEEFIELEQHKYKGMPNPYYEALEDMSVAKLSQYYEELVNLDLNVSVVTWLEDKFPKLKLELRKLKEVDIPYEVEESESIEISASSIERDEKIWVFSYKLFNVEEAGHYEGNVSITTSILTAEGKAVKMAATEVKHIRTREKRSLVGYKLKLRLAHTYVL